MDVEKKIQKLQNVILALKESDVYIEHIFMRGGCYRFFLFIKALHPEAKPYIHSKDKDHIVAKVFGRLFDIQGVIDKNAECLYSPLLDEDKEAAEKWSFSKNQLLQLRECPHCEEPIFIEPNEHPAVQDVKKYQYSSMTDAVLVNKLKINTMERKLELKDICGYLPYELKRVEVNPKNDNDFYVSSFYIHNAEFHIKKGDKPILRPLSDLYKTITHNGEEIVPIVELAKINYPENEFGLVELKNGEIYAQCGSSLRFFYVNGVFGSINGYGHTQREEKQYQLFEFLHELKIDYRGLIAAGLAVDCNTLENKPYK